MDFLDPAKKRIHAKRLTLLYILIAVCIGVFSVLLLFQSYGFDIDRKTGEIYQNGLVFVSARPEGADIKLNGQNKGGTDARFALPAGKYTIELNRTGYRTWKRTFTLDGGKLERLTYPLLFPEKLNPKDVQLYSAAPTFATNSPDRKWLLVQQPQTFTSFEVFDTSQENPDPKVINLADGLLTKSSGPESLETIEWSTDNRHVLLKHNFTGGYEFIMLDHENIDSSININRNLGINPVEVTLHDKKFDKLFVYDSVTQNLQTADLKTNAVQPYLSKVLAYKSYGSDTMLYVGDDGTLPGIVQAKLLDGGTTYVLRTLPANSSFVLDVARYSNNWFMVVGAKNEGFTSIYKNPQNQKKPELNQSFTPVSELRMEQTEFVSFSASTQFIAVQSGPKFAVYDAEMNRRYYFELPFPISADYQAKWMDGHRLMVVNNNQTYVLDFDGINLQTLSAANNGLSPFFDSDYTSLYTISPSVTVPGRAALTKTLLKASQ